MENKNNFYVLLGVNKNATQDEIKKAYHKKVLELHPDKNPDKDTNDEFIKVKIAYDVLSDINKRRQYDNSDNDTYDDNIYNNKTQYTFEELWMDIIIIIDNIFDKNQVDEEDRKKFYNTLNLEEIKKEFMTLEYEMVIDNITTKLMKILPTLIMNNLSKRYKFFNILFKGLPTFFIDNQ